MKIKQILSQHRRDFTAIYECEHCDATRKGDGYDDSFFHESAIPKMECRSCFKSSPEDYRPLATKYADGVQL